MKRFLIVLLSFVLLLGVSLSACTKAEPLRTIPEIPPENGSRSILILGNSFVGTSQIGAFLVNMLEQADRDYDVSAVSQGFATVATYSNNAELLGEIRDGKYCYVFQCGFYSPGELQEFETVKEACAESHTGIAAFPAHNEDPGAVSGLDSAACLNWQAEINGLIASGVPYDAMCINDAYHHSTPLAGYVGAHMIYRNLFGEIPPLPGDGAPLSADEVREQLGDYVYTGVVRAQK